MRYMRTKFKYLVNIFKHFKTIMIHKFWVFYYCCKARIIWRGIVHDISKFSPTEFFESVKFYQGNVSPIVKSKEVQGYSKAWLHHKGLNKHHYEYWQDNFDSGTTHLQMPFIYALECVCDYLGAGRAYQKKKFTYAGEYEWWLSKVSSGIAMDEHTKKFITIMLKILKDTGDLYYLNKKNSKYIYRDIKM